MIAVKTLDVTQDFKSIAERIMQGEIVLISRPKNENIVMITETEYNQLNKLRENIAARTLKDVLRETQSQAKINGTSEFTMDDINDIIAEVRKEKKSEQL
jgi:antitoxin YefM